MVWTNLCKCDPENRWCDQNLDGVKQLFKSVINILMVWSKLWRFENWWCEQNLDGVNKSFKSVINICMVWTKLWRCDFVNWWCEQIFVGVIKCWWCDETIFRCEQTSIFWKLCDHTIWCDLFTCFFLMNCWRCTGLSGRRSRIAGRERSEWGTREGSNVVVRLTLLIACR